MSDKKIIRTIIRIEEGSRPHQMLEELMEEKGYRNAPYIFLDALSVAHRKTFPMSYYSTKGIRSGLTDEETEEDAAELKAKRRKRKEEAAQKLAHARAVKMAEQLDDAVIYQDRNNVWRVRFFVYSDKNRYERIVPLESITEDTIKNQYYPSKQAVEDLWAKGNVNYDFTQKPEREA